MVNCNCVLLMIYVLLNVQSFETDACQEASTAFSISTRRNITGHWHSEVIMDIQTDEATDEDKRQTAPWNLAMSFNRKRCDGKETLSIVTAIKVPPLKPGPDYELFPGVGYYKFHPTPTTWNNARKICISEGGHLAILNSDIEANIAKQLFSRHKQLGDWAFIGFHDERAEGEYITVLGEPVQETGYTKWASGQPDNYNNEDCGSINQEANLNDLPCVSEVPFICESEL